MTIQFSSDLAILAVYNGLYYNMNYGSASSITIYSGSQPSSSTLISSWSSYNSSNSNFLAHWPVSAGGGPIWTVPYGNNSLPGPLYQLTPGSGVIATNTGTASWAILWSVLVSSASMAVSSIPLSTFIVVPVTLTTNYGVIRVNTLSVVSGQVYTIIDGSIDFTSP